MDNLNLSKVYKEMINTQTVENEKKELENLKEQIKIEMDKEIEERWKADQNVYLRRQVIEELKTK